MSFFQKLLSNRILLTALLAWAIAQVTKTILHAIVNRGIDWERLVGDGGMPSCHSATVCALATAAALHQGADSAIFALAAGMAMIVMDDARGVRRESGRHAKALNELLDLLMGEAAPEVKLKEMLGHSPLQVLIGALIGVGTAFLLWR